MVQLYLHAAIMLCSSMLLICFFTYGSLLLISYLTALITLVLFNCGCELFAVIIFFCEIHVIFMLTCLSLSWTKFDCQLVTTLSHEHMYSIAIAIMLPVFIVVIMFSTDITTNQSAQTSIPSFVLISHFSINTLTASSSTSAQLVSAALFIVCSFEFLLINIFLTLAVFMYLAIQKYASKAKYTKAAFGVAKSLSADIFGGYILRSQKLIIQLKRSPVVCVFVTTAQLDSWYKDGRPFKKLLKK